MVDLNSKYKTLLTEIKSFAPFEPQVALILGSGLGDFAKSIKIEKSISTSELTGYPKSTVEGHKGFIHFAELYGKRLLMFQGRIHFYEGYSISDCVVPIHIAKYLGCNTIILTNAAGGINSDFQPGDLMLITSFNSINIKTELSTLLGLSSVKDRNNFLDFPSNEVNNIIRKASLEEKIFLREGIYWMVKGPSYETISEIRMISKFGTDAVGMSTAHEAIYAFKVGMKVGAISLITNYAAGIAHQGLSHKEVIETAEKSKNKFEKLIKQIINLL